MPNFSKPILDEITRLLARQYGFTAEELDFILNYYTCLRQGFGGQAKYRLGLSADRQAATPRTKRNEDCRPGRFS